MMTRLLSRSLRSCAPGRHECAVGGSLQGETALHVAAGLPDGGRISQQLLDRCPAARPLWNSLRDAQGRSPADIAYM